MLFSFFMLSVGLVLVPAGPAQAAPPYPSPAPNFAHQGSPHSDLYSFTGGSLDRPVLVIYLLFNDVAAPAGRDAPWLANRFFGGFPSVTDYFADDSFGDLILTPAQETNTAFNGAANDGVAVVDMGSVTSFFSGNSDEERNRLAIDAANGAGVDFSVFDTNGNGTITDREVIVEIIEESALASGGCGIARSVASGGQVDGKNVGFRVAMNNTGTNIITIVHETAHVAFNMDDLYGFGVGRFDLAGPTCGPPDTSLFRMSAWQRMHLGWSSPVVVTRDGYAQINGADLAGESFILYDPSTGTDRYYMVEHRIRENGDYDQGASDDGLVIWRIDDSKYNSGNDAVRPIELVRPDGIAPPGCDPNGFCYPGSNTDAWDPSDPMTPQRTMDEAGGPDVAVRAINAPRSDGIVEAFFDVRGAGVLVDPNTPQGEPMRIIVTPEEAKAISFPVMNTGDDIDGSGGMSPTDTFDFSVSAPGGWASSTHTMTLTDHQGALANISLTPDPNAPTGITQVDALGASQTNAAVVTGAAFEVIVVLDPTSISYNGLTSVPTGEPAGFSALVTNPGDSGSPPVPGETVTFELSGPGGTLTGTGTTDAAGVATAGPTLSVPPGTYDLTVSVPRLRKHAPASISTTYTVERRPTTLTYTGDTSGQYSDPSTVSARLTDTLNGAPLAGFPLTLSLGTQSAPGVTDTDGRAGTSITITQPSGTVDAGAEFAGDTTYLPSIVAEPFDIAKEVLSFAYTGDTLAEAPGVPTLRSLATEESDATPGDLSLAGARYDLAPTLGTTPFDFTTGVDAAGLSSTPATGLPVDLWNVSVSVPASNGFWTGSTSAPTEVALYDPERNVTGDARGPDAGGSEVRTKLENLRFHQGSWHNRTRFEAPSGRFVGESYDWLIAVGNQAILQVHGSLDALPASLRLRLTDGASGDSFQALLTSLAVTYDSGLVSPAKGNLTVE
jgi:M6 family metalloprotease-like protein